MHTTEGRRILVQTLVVAVVCVLSCRLESSDQPPTGAWSFGENPPAATPEIFAPGTISKAGFHLHSSLAFSPDGGQLCFTKIVFEPTVQGTIWCARRGEGGWTEPQPAPFSGIHNDDSAVFSPDGKRIFFASNRPHGGAEPDPAHDLDIWFAERTDTGWGSPVHAGEALNSEHCDFRLSIAADGSVYLSSDRNAVEDGTFDIFIAEPVPGGYSKPVPIGAAINTPATEQIAFVAPDESYVVFYRHDRQKPEETGLYVSFQNDDGSWRVAKSLGAMFNSPPEAVTQAASLSPDGQQVFFLRRRHEAIYRVAAQTILSLR